MSGKKGKGRQKSQTLSIHEFNDGAQKKTVDFSSREVTVASDWSSEHGEMDYGLPHNETPKTVSLPTAPRSARDKTFDLSKAPDYPPFKLFVGNLSYDADEESITSFFEDVNPGTVINVELVREFDRMKGFGYVEFIDKAALIAGLELDGEPLYKRNMKVDFANESDRKGGTGDGRRNRDQPSGISDGDNNWRNGPRSTVPGRDYDRGPSRREGTGYSQPQDDVSSGMSNWRSTTSSRFNDSPSRSDLSQDRPQLKLAPRSVPAGETSPGEAKPSSSIFGAAKPVDTAKKFLEAEERLQSERPQTDRRDERDSRNDGHFATRDIRPNVERRVYNAAEPSDSGLESQPDRHGVKKPTASDVFGSAKPVDTAARDRDIEARMAGHKLPVSNASEPREASGLEPPPDRHAVKKPTASDVFGSAKPVDTAARDRDIEARMAGQKLPVSNTSEPRQASELEPPPDRPAVKKHTASDVFGAAKPVDTAARDRDIEARMAGHQVSVSNAAEPRQVEPQSDRHAVKKPSASDVFGAAKPVDTAARDRDIEARMAEREAASRQSDNRDSEPRRTDGHPRDRDEIHEPRRIEYKDRSHESEPRRIEYKRRPEGTERRGEEDRQPLRDANGPARGALQSKFNTRPHGSEQRSSDDRRPLRDANGSARVTQQSKPKEPRSERRRKEKSGPTSIDAMPKMEEKRGVKLNIQNPFVGMEIEGDDSDE